MSDHKMGYQSTINIVKDEKSILVADSHSILAKYKNYFSWILNVHNVNDVRQKEIHTAELSVLQPCAFQLEMAIEKLKTYKSLATDHMSAEVIKAGGTKICFEIHKVIHSIWNKKELPQ